MKTRRFLSVSVGVMVLSACLMSVERSAHAAQAAKKPGDMPAKLDEDPHVTQNWDKVLPAAHRFVVLGAFNNDAVRDNETGLVWEKSPDTTPMAWSDARGACANKNVGGRKGWVMQVVAFRGATGGGDTQPPTAPGGWGRRRPRRARSTWRGRRRPTTWG